MPDPTGRVSHLPHFHRGVAWKQPVRVATTASITIATALNNGDSLDGVTLATGDRVLVKDQSTASQNGIYVVGTSPGRDYDFDQDGTTTVPAEEIAGAFVYVLAGTVNAGTLWHTTNVAGGTLGTTSVVWEEFTTGTPGVTDHHDLTGRDLAGDHDWAAWSYGGGHHVIATIADAGASETLDLSTANVFDIGLSTGCTLSFSNPPSDGTAGLWQIIFSGSFLVTWPGSVVWLDGDGTAPAASTTLAVTLVTLDGGTTYLATAGRGAVGVDSLDDLTDVTLTTPVSGDLLRYNGSEWVNAVVSTTGIGEILISDTPSTPLVFADLIQNEAQDDLVYADP